MMCDREVIQEHCSNRTWKSSGIWKVANHDRLWFESLKIILNVNWIMHFKSPNLIIRITILNSMILVWFEFHKIKESVSSLLTSVLHFPHNILIYSVCDLKWAVTSERFHGLLCACTYLLGKVFGSVGWGVSKTIEGLWVYVTECPVRYMLTFLPTDIVLAV